MCVCIRRKAQSTYRKYILYVCMPTDTGQIQRDFCCLLFVTNWQCTANSKELLYAVLFLLQRETRLIALSMSTKHTWWRAMHSMGIASLTALISMMQVQEWNLFRLITSADRKFGPSAMQNNRHVILVVQTLVNDSYGSNVNSPETTPTRTWFIALVYTNALIEAVYLFLSSSCHQSLSSKWNTYLLGLLAFQGLIWSGI